MPVLFLLLLSLTPGTDAGTTPCAEVRKDPQLVEVMASAPVQGALLFWRKGDRHCLSSEPARAQVGLLPASTFKLFNALLALQAGAVADAEERLPWDGVDRGGPGWNRDHDLGSALQNSAVWFYQAMARRIGTPTMAEWLQRVGYGNARMGSTLEDFWLQGDLRISPLQQIAFLDRLHDGRLPFDARHQATVRDLMRLPSSNGATLRGKTGWATAARPQVGWFVGWFEHGEDTWYFATVVDILAPPDARERRSLTDQAWALLVAERKEQAPP